MITPSATPYAAAIAEIVRRGIRPTPERGAELAQVVEQFQEDAIFSAGNVIEDALAEIKSSVEQLLAPFEPGGSLDRAQARLNIRQKLEAAGVTGEAASNDLTSLVSDARINLVLDHWTTMARERGRTVRNNDADLLWSHPCYELTRFEHREQKRHWIERWRGAGGIVYPGHPSGPSLNPELTEGRLIARKDDPIWFRISRFNRAESPYDFNSGVGRQAVARAECVKLGVIKPGEQVGPTPLKSPYPDPQQEANN